MKNYKEHKIKEVLPGSIAEELGIEAGDLLIAINGQEIEDVFDYRYLISDEFVTLTICKKDMEWWEYEIEKDVHEDIGLVFENALMDHLKSCRNKCVFCFIDQLPPSMRKSVYFKDDDWRMSFLNGNYITLTNMKEKDFERLIYYHLSPVNISVHATDPEVRIKMLNNRFAGDVLGKIKRIVDAGIEVNCQIVLCKGLNDGLVLKKTLDDLEKFFPGIKSISIVPVGISKYRENLYPLIPFEKDDAKKIIRMVHHLQDFYKEKYGSYILYCADEFYITAGEEIPPVHRYEDFPQIENGVGMLALMEEEFNAAFLDLPDEISGKIDLSVATGIAAFPFIKKLVNKLLDKYSNLTIRVYPIKNDFFGDKITVSGLMTGQDIIKQLNGKELGSKLLLPENAFRNNDTIFLDDVYLDDLEKEFRIPVEIVGVSGKDFIHAILNAKENRDE